MEPHFLLYADRLSPRLAERRSLSTIDEMHLLSHVPAPAPDVHVLLSR
jgi:hypothetical protein